MTSDEFIPSSGYISMHEAKRWAIDRCFALAVHFSGITVEVLEAYGGVINRNGGMGGKLAWRDIDPHAVETTMTFAQGVMLERAMQRAIERGRIDGPALLRRGLASGTLVAAGIARDGQHVDISPALGFWQSDGAVKAIDQGETDALEVPGRRPPVLLRLQVRRDGLAAAQLREINRRLGKPEDAGAAFDIPKLEAISIAVRAFAPPATVDRNDPAAKAAFRTFLLELLGPTPEVKWPVGKRGMNPGGFLKVVTEETRKRCFANRQGEGVGLGTQTCRDYVTEILGEYPFPSTSGNSRLH